MEVSWFNFWVFLSKMLELIFRRNKSGSTTVWSFVVSKYGTSIKDGTFFLKFPLMGIAQAIILIKKSEILCKKRFFQVAFWKETLLSTGTSITSLFVCMIVAIKKFEWKQKLNNYSFIIFDQLMFGLCRKSTLCNGYVLSKIFFPCLALIVRFGTQKLFWTNSLPLSSIENITEYYLVLPLSTNIKSHKIWGLIFFKILEVLLGIIFYPGKQQNDSGTKYHQKNT